MVPLLNIQLTLAVRLPKNKTGSWDRNMSLASVIIAARGDPGEIQDDFTARWMRLAVAAAHFSYVDSNLLAEVNASIDQGLVGSPIETSPRA